MRVSAKVSAVVAALSLVFCLPLLGAQTLQVAGTDGKATSLSAAQIAGIPHVKVSVQDHGATSEFEGVPLAEVLTAAGIKMGDSMRGPRMAEAMLVEAADNYKVVFALAEVDPEFATREIILADKKNGKPLDAKEGPFRVVAPGDKRGARWVRQLTAIRIVVVK
jgi:DMSO/TMAO reductase YedYZ molybdopterin-dependent catalytic subunit